MVTAVLLIPVSHKVNNLHIRANKRFACSLCYSPLFISLTVLSYETSSLWTPGVLRFMHALNRYGWIKQVFIHWNQCCIQRGTNICMLPAINLFTPPVMLGLQLASVLCHFCEKTTRSLLLMLRLSVQTVASVPKLASHKDMFLFLLLRFVLWRAEFEAVLFLYRQT
jgi:hypothetical protein